MTAASFVASAVTSAAFSAAPAARAAAARYTGGLWVGKFLKTVTTQRVTAQGSAVVAESAAAVPDAELMFGHAISARLILNPEYFPDALFPEGSP